MSIPITSNAVPCFYAFCWSAIPTSYCIFDVFLFILVILLSDHCLLLCSRRLPHCGTKGEGEDRFVIAPNDFVLRHSYANACKNKTGAYITLEETTPYAYIHHVFHMSCAVIYAYSFTSNRQALSCVTALIRSTSTNWWWSPWYSIHWGSGLLWWTKCWWWWLVMLNPTQDLVSMCIILVARNLTQYL